MAAPCNRRPGWTVNECPHSNRRAVFHAHRPREIAEGNVGMRNKLCDGNRPAPGVGFTRGANGAGIGEVGDVFHVICVIRIIQVVRGIRGVDGAHVGHRPARRSRWI